jgi:hypothetical protein
MEENLEFQVSEVFPSLLIKKDLTEHITETILSNIDNMVDNMSEEIPLSEAFSSRRKMNTILDLQKFGDLRDHIMKSIMKYALQQYQLQKLDIVESFVIHVPKNGYFEIRKNYDSTFNILINISSSTNIVLHNPIYITKSMDYSVEVPNKYNSQYSFSSFNKNESIMIPSGIYYGFPKREEDLKFITIIVR